MYEQRRAAMGFRQDMGRGGRGAEYSSAGAGFSGNPLAGSAGRWDGGRYNAVRAAIQQRANDRLEREIERKQTQANLDRAYNFQVSESGRAQSNTELDRLLQETAKDQAQRNADRQFQLEQDKIGAGQQSALLKVQQQQAVQQERELTARDRYKHGLLTGANGNEPLSPEDADRFMRENPRLWKPVPTAGMGLGMGAGVGQEYDGGYEGDGAADSASVPYTAPVAQIAAPPVSAPAPAPAVQPPLVPTAADREMLAKRSALRHQQFYGTAPGGAGASGVAPILPPAQGYMSDGSDPRFNPGRQQVVIGQQQAQQAADANRAQMEQQRLNKGALIAQADATVTGPPQPSLQARIGDAVQWARQNLPAAQENYAAAQEQEAQRARYDAMRANAPTAGKFILPETREKYAGATTRGPEIGANRPFVPAQQLVTPMVMTPEEQMARQSKVNAMNSDLFSRELKATIGGVKDAVGELVYRPVDTLAGIGAAVYEARQAGERDKARMQPEASGKIQMVPPMDFTPPDWMATRNAPAKIGLDRWGQPPATPESYIQPPPYKEVVNVSQTPPATIGEPPKPPVVLKKAKELSIRPRSDMEKDATHIVPRLGYILPKGEDGKEPSPEEIGSLAHYYQTTQKLTEEEAFHKAALEKGGVRLDTPISLNAAVNKKMVIPQGFPLPKGFIRRPDGVIDFEPEPKSATQKPKRQPVSQSLDITGGKF